jgi:hypothetical protein
VLGQRGLIRVQKAAQYAVHESASLPPAADVLLVLFAGTATVSFAARNCVLELNNLHSRPLLIHHRLHYHASTQLALATSGSLQQQ